MPDRQLPPFRADHVGSLLRPERVRRARALHAQGQIGDDGLRAVEDEAIQAVVAQQEAVGLRSATDGEFRRGSWIYDFLRQVGGVVATDAGPSARGGAVWQRAPGAGIPAPATGAGTRPLSLDFASRLHLDRVIFADDFGYLKRVVTTATPKVTIPSPSMLHWRGGDAAVTNGWYADLDQFWSDVIDVWAAELHGLAALGCSYVQLDDTSLAFMTDPRERAALAARGSDPDTQHHRYVDTINAVLARKPPGMTVTLHTCRGNMQSAWSASGSYDFIAEAVFGALAADGFFLEYDDERSGSFEPLRYVRPGATVALGLVTTKSGRLEDKDTLKRRIEEAAKVVPIEQLCLAPQCGFASVEAGNLLTEEEQFAKLRLVVEVAAEVWG